MSTPEGHLNIRKVTDIPDSTCRHNTDHTISVLLPSGINWGNGGVSVHGKEGCVLDERQLWDLTDGCKDGIRIPCKGVVSTGMPNMRQTPQAGTGEEMRAPSTLATLALIT